MPNQTVNSCIPIKEPADRYTGTAKAAVTGKRVVQIAGPRVSGGIGAGASPGGAAFMGKGLADSAEGARYVVGHPNCSGAQGAAKRCIGVSAWDAAIGQEVTIINDGILPITCSTAIVAGNEVQAAADGRIEPVGTGAVNGVPIGMAMDSQATVGGDCEILWYK